MDKRWHWNRPIASSLVLCIGAILCSFSLLYSPSHLRLNLSSSLPKRLFLTFTSGPPFATGQIVSIDHPELQATVGKIIAGRPGDWISIRNQYLFLNDSEIGYIKTTSESGKIYHSIPEGPIPEGSYFVYTPHPDSFDSRYAEFGLVKEGWIKEVLWPLF